MNLLLQSFTQTIAQLIADCEAAEHCFFVADDYLGSRWPSYRGAYNLLAGATAVHQTCFLQSYWFKHQVFSVPSGTSIFWCRALQTWRFEVWNMLKLVWYAFRAVYGSIDRGKSYGIRNRLEHRDNAEDIWAEICLRVHENVPTLKCYSYTILHIPL